MSKLFELKKWMSVKDAAIYLGKILKEDVSEADIYQLALDGHLRLSVDLLNHASARLGTRLPLDEAKLLVLPGIIFPPDGAKERRDAAFKQLRSQLSASANHAEKLEFIKQNTHLFESRDLVAFYSGTEMPDGTVITFTEEIVTLGGIWDLPMIASEKIDIQDRLQHLIDGPPVELINTDGTFLVSCDGKTYASIQCRLDPDGPRTPVEGKPPAYDNPSDFFPSSILPEDANLIVRVESMSLFLQTLEGPTKPLDERERVTLLNIIGALAEKAKLDIRQHNKAGQFVANLLQEKGIAISGRTIGDHFKIVPEAMDSRKVK